MRLERGPEAVHRVVEDRADQRLLGRKVVMQRRDVDADLGCDVARPQAFETTLRELGVGGEHQRLAPLRVAVQCTAGMVGTVSSASISTTLRTSPVSRNTRSCRSALVPPARIVCTYSTADREPRSSTA